MIINNKSNINYGRVNLSLDSKLRHLGRLK
jgi:hypothetical protein